MMVWKRYSISLLNMAILGINVRFLGCTLKGRDRFPTTIFSGDIFSFSGEYHKSKPQTVYNMYEGARAFGNFFKYEFVLKGNLGQGVGPLKTCWIHGNMYQQETLHSHIQQGDDSLKSTGLSYHIVQLRISGPY